jgi:peptidyl-prolyl cis-trans isomerase SurA
MKSSLFFLFASIISASLFSQKVPNSLIKEAYQRSHYDLRVSHILIKVDLNASEADTLKAYDTIMAIRKRIIENGEDFGKVAAQSSEDPSARDQPAVGTRSAYKGNYGDLGYFTVLDLLYPFETAAYNAEIGKVTMPVRTKYGYHLILLTDKQPAMGKVQVEIILKTIPANSSAVDSAVSKRKMKEIYYKIKTDSSFENMAKNYSDDKASAAKGGLIPVFGVNRMVPEFIIAIRALKKPGDISEPVLTSFGWYIIKLIEKKPIGSYKAEKETLKERIAKDTRIKRK